MANFNLKLPKNLTKYFFFGKRNQLIDLGIFSLQNHIFICEKYSQIHIKHLRIMIHINFSIKSIPIVKNIFYLKHVDGIIKI